ncbi:ABC transporter ATP-binding protein [Clostridium brassicae]|uniref:ABC transporter ATP-binding protein n=1 Tax=Clostridium brassicae TaxID=2999072 RepID=A0ABT4DBS4_9CLOT|nr:ABC transporter ATP-binding protein [Clostridium brassicae]MCY6958489.1 ABC transporter ATP-binding protein [Clostridium brassicae]
MSDKEIIKKLLKLLEKYKKIIIFIFLCLMISTALNLCIPLISKHIMDDGFIGGDKNLVIILALSMTGIYFVSYVLDIMKEKARIEIAAKIQYSLSEESFFHLMKINSKYFTSINYAEILNNINFDINTIASIADGNLFFVLTQGFSMLGGIIGLFIIDYRMAIMVLIFIPLKYIVMKSLAKKRKFLMDNYIESSQMYANWFGDSVGGINEIKIFNLLLYKWREFSTLQKRIIDKHKKMDMLGQWNTIIDKMIIQILIMFIYIIGANLVFNMELSVGSVFAFITYSAYVTGPISAILNVGYFLSGIIPSTKRYYEFLNFEEESNIGYENKPDNGDIAFKNVSFQYEKEKNVLKNVDFVFRKGMKYALIGKNGSGKSTMINLITRILEPTNGYIEINDVDITKYKIYLYRDMISGVSQQVYLFNDTIRNNICLYKEVNESILLKAIQDSGLEDFINEVSLEYVVGQNGSMLSGGQKQKIAMARALVHDKPIIIFDEATSNMDAYTDKQINSLINTSLKGKTVIVVTHKQEILKDVDNIVMLDNGNIYEGDYEELNMTSAIFREMINIRG